jgi:hypothetical protein
MPNEPQNTNFENDSWKDEQISLQDIVLSNSWAVQAILNYLEECDPNARERIWRHYEMMKKQQDAAHNGNKNSSSDPSDFEDE